MMNQRARCSHSSIFWHLKQLYSRFPKINIPWAFLWSLTWAEGESPDGLIIDNPVRDGSNWSLRKRRSPINHGKLALE
jgi:hypothetical protein